MVRKTGELSGVGTHIHLRARPSEEIAVLMEGGVRAGLVAHRLARELNLAVVDIAGVTRFHYILVKTPERLELRDNFNRRARPLYVDISASAVHGHARKLSRRQPLARALGRRTRTVVDATAGLGQDAFLMAGMGYTVTAVERSPIIAALLSDGVARGCDDERLRAALVGRLSVVTGDARDVLPTMHPKPDAIYMDPMFPPKRKRSTLPKKALRVLRDLVGDDDDATDLLAVCLQHAKHRVVVKRPHHAAALPLEPAISYEGKMVRYDVYLNSA